LPSTGRIFKSLNLLYRFAYLYDEVCFNQIVMKKKISFSVNPVNTLFPGLLIAGSLFLRTYSLTQNYVTTFAGTGSPGFVNGDTSTASFNKPFGICIDSLGNLFIADAYNHVIRKIGIDGMVSTFAGSGIAGYADGEASVARFNQPINICFDPYGNMFVSDFLNQRIRKIDTSGMVSTIAGSGIAGLLDGISMDAQFNYPRGICIDDTGNIYIGDSWNHRIRRISTDGWVTTWAGGGENIGVQSIGSWVDGSDTAARFYTPCELSIDSENNIYVADAYNHRIRKVDSDRTVTTVAGSGESGPNSGGFQNGPALESRFNTPTAVSKANSGEIFVGDGINQRVRRIDTGFMVSTFAGSGETGFSNGADTSATFNFPRGCTMDYNLNRLYVVDYNNHAVRIVHLETATGGLLNQKMPDGILIYPNPSQNKITVEFGSAVADVGFRLLDLSGRDVCFPKSDCLSKQVMNLAFLEPGIYLMQIYSGTHVISVNKIILLDQ
jgi:hypothetical protein